MPINPALRPISEAPDDRPVILYGADKSPMWLPSIGASVDLGWKGTGSTPGFHTARFGFFDNEGTGNPDGFRFTHFAEVPTFEA